MVSLINKFNSYKYIIDTSAILSQKDDRPHRRKIYKSQWNNIDELVRNNIIVTCSEIAGEVEDDQIKNWMKENGLVVLPIDDEVQENVKQVVAANKSLVDFKACKSSGDAFLIATAIKYRLIVITEESQQSTKKIPFTCRELGVDCINILDLCEREMWTF